MGVTVKNFGKTTAGVETQLYMIENKNGMKAGVTNFGAILVNLFVKGADGRERDVVLGFDSVEGYLDDGNCFGATVGPIANRTANAKFEVNGVTYQMDVNDNANNLHTSHTEGFQKRVWDASYDESSVTFSLVKKDMEMGHPGELKVAVTYTLTDDNELKIHYHADTDKETIINMTNHTYFNLDGHDSDEIYDELLWMKASHYTPVVKGAIPTGEIAPVAGTPMDFTTAKKVGQDIYSDFEQIGLVGGYDHNWVVDDWNGELQLIAKVEDKKSGIVMDTYTDLPGVQFYAGNFVGKDICKGGVLYGPRKGLCLETQYFPNSANEANFPRPLYGPDKAYDTTTVYKFYLV